MACFGTCTFRWDGIVWVPVLSTCSAGCDCPTPPINGPSSTNPPAFLTLPCTDGGGNDNGGIVLHFFDAFTTDVEAIPAAITPVGAARQKLSVRHRKIALKVSGKAAKRRGKGKAK